MKMIRSEAKTVGGFFRHFPLTAGGFFRHLPLTVGGFFRHFPLTAGGFFRHLPLTVGGFFRHLPLTVGGLFCASSGSSTSAFLALALAVLGVPADGMSFTLDKNVPAGNIALDRIEGDTVYVHQELRDTSGDWFYWAFRVTGAQGRTLDFRFTKSVAVGTRGPCVSLDLGQTWNYAAENGATRTSFRYTFPTNATEVWFYETIPYLQTDWEAFLARHAADRGTVFETGVLCQSRKGRNVEKAVFGNLSGNPKHRIFLSARRHCSETMASFVMEGILESVFAQDETGAWYRANVEIMAVPFMDKDGCEEGDQGKNRQPHDHNRDYTDFLYPETRGIRDWIAERADNKLDIFFDFHCPWLYGNYNEFVYQVHGKQAENTAKMIAFGKIVEALQTGSMAYREADDLRWGVSWNSDANYTAGRAVKMWALEELSCGFVSEFEIPFATANGMVVTRESCREFGRDTARAFRRFLEEVQTPLEGPDIWYQVSSAPDRFWTTTNGWVTGSGTPLQRLPSFRDRVTMNSSQTGPDNPLIIPAGQEAVCGTLYLASIAGTANNYAADGRIPTLQLHGGTLSTPSNTWDLTAVTVGRAKGGYGLLKIESGSLVTNTCLAVGYEGIGEVRNNGGSLHFGTSGTRNLTLGARASGTGRYVQESGSFIGSMHLSQNGGTGTVEIAGGTVKGNVYAGCGEIGLGTLSLRGGSVTGDLTIGQLGRGIWEMSGGSYSGTPVIGKSGTGEFRFRGGTVSIPNLTLGESA
ncbi:MAG: hypothetical protein IJR99_08580, partial [Kiritimatiellae bacterium]|nr:hypothetical protein [Kiritimatiellia bacterium]